MARLFSPLKIRECELKNRIAVSPMCQYSGRDGFANDWHLVHLGARAVGGAGLVMTEATAVSPEGRISPGDLGLWSDDHIEPLRRITRFIMDQQSVPGIQLAHAGRKGSRSLPWNGDLPLSPGSGGWQTVAPSAASFGPGYDTPRALTEEEIDAIVGAFRDAASRADRAGFRVAEIHAAHGYLIHEFLSPLSNARTDAYGGGFGNRVRLLCRVAGAVRSVWPHPLFVRISVTDWAEGGWTAEESVELARLLGREGVDLIDCSSGGIAPGIRIPAAPGYQVPFAARIKKEAGILTGAVGMITEPAQAEAVIAGEQADLVLLAREFLRNPSFPLSAARALNAEAPWPVQYLRAKT